VSYKSIQRRVWLFVQRSLDKEVS
ncbi:hypothetical protein KGM_213840B, partial [Danaus plexippus plexippus]